MLKKMFSALAIGLACGKALAETATVPWAEFKDLYTEHLQKTLRADADKAAAGGPGYTLRRADIRLRVDGDSAIGEIVIAGETLRDPPLLVPLIDGTTTIADVREQSGGTVVRSAEGIALRSNSAGAFQVRLDMVIPIEQDRNLRAFTVQSPQAIANAMAIVLPDGARFVTQPGVAGPDGLRHIAAGQTHTVRFIAAQEDQTAMAPTIDIFTELSLNQHRLRLVSLLAPQQTTAGPFELTLPAGARLISTTIRDSWWQSLGDGRYRVDLPADLASAVEITTEIDAADQRELALSLPSIKDNLGAEGNFSVREPVQTRILVKGAGLATNMPAEQLPEPIRERWPALAEFDYSSDNQPMTVTLEKLKTVTAPALVLDAVTFTTSLGEDGQLLTTLRLDVPATAGPRLSLKPVPDSEIWSVLVNGERREILNDDGRTWIVPLDGDAAAHVEISLLSRRDKPALAGKLDLALPETGLTARTVYYGLTLPHRLELVSMESDLTPQDPATLAANEVLKGTPYVFSRAFYRGEKIPVALMYREPVTANATPAAPPVAAAQ
jgi:hypothetical protein